MTYIPDAREKYLTDIHGKDTGKINGYWEGFLSKNDKKIIMGFDWAAEQIENALEECEEEEDKELLELLSGKRKLL